MKSIVILLYLIAVVQCELNNTNLQDIIRRKRQDGGWVWGQTPENNNPSTRNIEDKSTTQTKTSAPAPDVPKPCDPYVPPRAPDFTAGRRISEAKCLEYIWEMKNRHDQTIHDDKCTQWRTQFFGRRFIIGGADATPGEFPHMGALGWRTVKGTWIFKCGSSLISPKFAVTAAHCSKVAGADTSLSDPRPQIVRLGDKNIMDRESNDMAPVDAKISKIIVHPQYAAPRKYYDIALVELEEALNFTKYLQPACLWGRDTLNFDSQPTVTGWGYINSARTASTPELQVASVKFIDQDQCDALLESSRTRHFSGLQSHQLCAGDLKGGVDTCQGDSGGPLQVKISLPITTEGSLHFLVGVTSFGIGCARENSPGVYTRVASFIDWIEDNVWGINKNLAKIFPR